MLEFRVFLWLSLVEKVTAISVVYILVPSLADLRLCIRTVFLVLFSYYNSFVKLSIYKYLEQQGMQVVEDEDSHADLIDDLQRNVVATQSHTEPSEDRQFCTYCRNSPCLILSENLPSKLKAQGQPRMTNHTKRKGDYKAFYTILKRRGLWHYLFTAKGSPRLLHRGCAGRVANNSR